MPWFAEGEDPLSPVPGYGPPDVVTPPVVWTKPSTEEVLGAAFRQSNSIVSTLSAIASMSSDSVPDPNWNPRSIIRGTHYEDDYLQDFLGDRNESQTRARMAKIDAEERDRQTLAASGWAGFVAGLGAGVFDPINLIPVVGETAKGVGVARSMLGTGARMAATGAVSTAALEAVLHATQQTRTFEESAGNVASGTLLMGILGNAMGAFSPREARTIARDFDAVRREFSPKPPPLGIAPADEVAGTFTFEKESAPGGGAAPPPPAPPRQSLRGEWSLLDDDERELLHARLSRRLEKNGALKPSDVGVEISNQLDTASWAAIREGLNNDPKSALDDLLPSSNKAGEQAGAPEARPPRVEGEAPRIPGEGDASRIPGAGGERTLNDQLDALALEGRTSVRPTPQERFEAESRGSMALPDALYEAGSIGFDEGRLRRALVSAKENNRPDLADAIRKRMARKNVDSRTGAETEADRLARVSRDIEDRKRSIAEWAPVPDSVFRGEADQHLATIFRSGSYDGTRVPLKNAGLSEEDITRLNRAGLADEEGKMSAGQFAQYEQARDARGLPAREAPASANGRVAEPEQALAAARAKEPEPGAVSETPTIPDAAAEPAAPSSVETAARDMAANAKQALEDSGTEFDRLASQAISDHVEPLLDQAFPKVEAAPAPYKKQSEKVKAETLLAFIKRMGGIKDTGGDLKAADWIRGYPGLVNNKRGMDLDQAREAAAEAGYLGANTGQAMAGTRAADLLNALANHPTYSIHDIPEAARAATAREENGRHVQIERASQSIDAHLSEVGQKPLDPEMRSTAAEILLEQDVPNIDAAIEAAAYRLVEEAAEHARVHREEPQFPELDFDFTPVHEIARGETHPGPYFGDGPGAEGDAGAARREVLPAEGNRAQDQGEAGRPAASVAEQAPSTVFDDFRQKMLGAGVPAETAEAQAALMQARYETRAVRLGMAPEQGRELYDQAGWDVRHEERAPAEAGADTFFQPPTVPTFHSAVERAVTGAKLAKGSPEQWLATIRNTAGVKPEEMQWLGLADWLKGQKGSVTREAVADYVRANAIDVHEVRKGEWKPPGIGDRFREMFGPDRSVLESTHRERGIAEAAANVEHELIPENLSTQYGQYTLPGGENYRELLLTLPSKEDAAIKALEKANPELLQAKGFLTNMREDLARAIQRGAPDDVVNEMGVNVDKQEQYVWELRQGLLDSSNVKIPEDYKSGHWEEPNILSHVRFDDRVIDGQRALHIAEVQSDWHQQGRQRGYQGVFRETTLDDLADGAVQSSENPIGGEAKWEFQNKRTGESAVGWGNTEHEAKLDALRWANSDMARIKAVGLGVPDAPFKTTWPELAIKRMIRYAAENGYDRVTWDTGATNAERYDLRHHIDSVAYAKEADGKYHVVAMKGTEPILSRENQTEREIEDIFGKEVAQRIIDGKGVVQSHGSGMKELSGVDLKVGGEGMAGFYDKILPAAVAKLTKKFGGKVEDATLPGEAPTGKSGWTSTESVGDHPAAQVHSLTLTPALKDAALAEGFPLFQPGEAGPRASITMRDNQALVRLFGEHDPSKLIHESGHQFLSELASDAAREGAPAQLKGDFDSVLKWLGAKDAESVTREQHEKFATGFERYVATGKAPSENLKGVFERFKQWLTQIYRRLTELGQEIPGEIRGVFDRMLATDEEIAAASRDRIPPASEEPARPSATEAGPEGTQQTLIPGVAPVTDADRLVAAAAKPMRGGDKTMPEDGLFDENIRLQRDMFDAGVPDKQHVQALMDFDRGMAGATSGPGAAGAAPSDVRTLKLKNYGLPAIVKAIPVVGAVAGKVGDALNKLSPTLRVFSSPSVQAKRMMADLAETALVFEDNARGIPTSYNGPPLDRLIRAQTHQLMIAANKHLEDEFVAYRYGDTPPRLPLERSVYEDLRGQAAGKMSFAQFKGLVSEALYSGDRSTIPQVELAAQHLRRDVIDPVARYAQSVKGPDGRPMLAEELGPPPGDKSYAPRVWNKEAIIAKRNQANIVFTDWLQNEQATKAAAKDRLIDLKFRHDDIALNASRMDRKLAVFEKRIAETDQALKERAMETNRATDRVETLEERNAQIDADAEELRQVLAESRSAVTARDADPFDMEMYDNLRRDLATLQRRRARNEIRRDEAGIPVSASQSRFMDLADRKARYEMMRDVLTSARANEESQRLVLREKMEEEVNNWQGNTSREAKTALAARAEAERVRALKQAAQVYQGKGDRLTGADAAVDKAVDNVIKSDRDLTREELSRRADEIIDRLISSPDGRLSYDTKPIVGEPKYTGGQEVRGHLRGREFPIPSVLVKDFIENDTQHLISSYLRSILPDTMLTQRFGDFEMREGFRKLNEEYAARGAGMTEAQLIALNREKQGNIRDLAATRDRLRGVYGWTDDPLQRNAARVAAVARNWNVVADLGTVTANSFNDAGAGGVFRHGIMNVMHDSWRPMFMALTGNPTLAKAYREQAKAASIGVEGILGRSAHNLGDVIDNYRPGSKFERGLAWVTEKSMIVNLLGPWTDTMKTMASGVAAAEVLRAVERVATGAEAGRDLEKLAAASIDRAMAVKIWENFSDGGGAVIEGTPVANTADWKSMSARQAFEAAISREADIAVVTPGAEKPLWLSRPIAGLIGQFKGYIAASYERTLIAGLQQRDARTLQGLLVAVGAGMLSYRLYTWLSGREASDNPADWVKEGISRSGVLSWFFEANEDLARFTKGASDVNRLYGATRPLLRRDQSGLEALLGPTYSRLEGLSGAVGDGIRAILPGDKPKIVWTAQDTHKLRQVLLFQNLMGVRILFDKVEDGINDALGIPARRKTPTWDAAGEIAPPQGSLSAPAPPP